MGTAWSYRCSDCGADFSAAEDFSYGFSGEVQVTVVCATHGMTWASAGVNVRDGGTIADDIRAKATYPCDRCGIESPRWDRRSCPECGSKRIEVAGQIMFD